jgi:hypothetical protein
LESQPHGTEARDMGNEGGFYVVFGPVLRTRLTKALIAFQDLVNLLTITCTVTPHDPMSALPSSRFPARVGPLDL